jgi:uncharacterized membrane protein
LWKLIFLYPFWFIVSVLLLGALGVASDVMQLTNFNFLDFITEHSPQSYLYIVLSTIIVYFILVVIGLLRNATQSSASQTGANTNSSNNVSQSMKTRDVNNSTIIQSGRDTKK